VFFRLLKSTRSLKELNLTEIFVQVLLKDFFNFCGKACGALSAIWPRC